MIYCGLSHDENGLSLSDKIPKILSKTNQSEKDDENFNLNSLKEFVVSSSILYVIIFPHHLAPLADLYLLLPELFFLPSPLLSREPIMKR
jgi:hypothetical protein